MLSLNTFLPISRNISPIDQLRNYHWRRVLPRFSCCYVGASLKICPREKENRVNHSHEMCTFSINLQIYYRAQTIAKIQEFSPSHPLSLSRRSGREPSRSGAFVNSLTRINLFTILLCFDFPNFHYPNHFSHRHILYYTYHLPKCASCDAAHTEMRYTDV